MVRPFWAESNELRSAMSQMTITTEGDPQVVVTRRNPEPA